MFQSSGYLTLSPFAESRDGITVFAELAINATRENQETTMDAPPTVYPCSPNFELNNWKAVEIPIVYKLLRKSLVWAYHFGTKNSHFVIHMRIVHFFLSIYTYPHISICLSILPSV